MKHPALALLLVAGCAVDPPLPETIRVPVPVPCVTAIPVPPAFLTPADLLALDDFQFPIALTADWLKRQQYQAELEAVLLACR